MLKIFACGAINSQIRGALTRGELGMGGGELGGFPLIRTTVGSSSGPPLVTQNNKDFLRSSNFDLSIAYTI